jgi:rhomboid protease GluP
MPLRQTSGSVVCPRCGRLAGVLDKACYNCGRGYPGLFGFSPLLGKFGRFASFGELMFWSCAAIYLITVLLKPDGILSGGGGILSLFGPERLVLFLFGGSGAAPVFGYGRWWTVLSAGFLHGGILHIYFNLSGLRPLVAEVENVLGLGRTILIYTIATIGGFALTSAVRLITLNFFPGAPRFLAGADLSVGASAAICGLVGAMLAYGQKTGQFHMQRYARNSMIAVLIMGFLLPYIDNWAHIGGFAGGWAATRLLRPLEDESPLHLLGGLICLVLMAVSIVASIVHGLPIYHQLMAAQP